MVLVVFSLVHQCKLPKTSKPRCLFTRVCIMQCSSLQSTVMCSHCIISQPTLHLKACFVLSELRTHTLSHCYMRNKLWKKHKRKITLLINSYKLLTPVWKLSLSGRLAKQWTRERDTSTKWSHSLSTNTHTHTDSAVLQDVLSLLWPSLLLSSQSQTGKCISREPFNLIWNHNADIQPAVNGMGCPDVHFNNNSAEEILNQLLIVCIIKIVYFKFSGTKKTIYPSI